MTTSGRCICFSDSLHAEYSRTKDFVHRNINVPKEIDTLAYDLSLRPVSMKGTPYLLLPGWWVRIYWFLPRVRSCNIMVGAPTGQEQTLFFLEKLKTWGLRAWSLETSRQKIRPFHRDHEVYWKWHTSPEHAAVEQIFPFWHHPPPPVNDKTSQIILGELQVSIFPLACKFLLPLRRQGIILQSLLSADVEWDKSTVSRQQSTGSLQLWWEGFAESKPWMMPLFLWVQQ